MNGLVGNALSADAVVHDALAEIPSGGDMRAMLPLTISEYR